MKFAKILIIAALISFIISVYFRFSVNPFFNLGQSLPIISLGKAPLEPHSFLKLSDTCLLFAIAIGILELIKQKKGQNKKEEQ